MNERQKELERRRLWLVAQADRQRRRLINDGETAGHWIRLGQMIALAAVRAARLQRYWNHSMQP